MDLVQRTFKVCDEALQSARMTAADIDAVILVGGPTRLPIIRNSVKHYFQKEPMEGIDPDQVVAMGAALQAHALLDSAHRDLPGRRDAAVAAHRHGGRLHREDHRQEHPHPHRRSRRPSPPAATARTR